MFELPELLTLAVQVNETLDGKVVRKGSLGDEAKPWGSRPDRIREQLESSHPLTAGNARGVTPEEALCVARWLPFDPPHLQASRGFEPRRTMSHRWAAGCDRRRRRRCGLPRPSPPRG